MENFDVKNTFSEEPSKAEILQLLNTYEPNHAAELAYHWLETRLLLQYQMAAERKEGTTEAIPAVNLWNMLSSLARYEESMSFSIDIGIQNNKIVFVIGNTLEEKRVSLLVEELLRIIFARLARIESHITYAVT